MNVRRGRLHPAQPEVALLVQLEPGGEARRRAPTGWPPVTWRIVDLLRTVGQRAPTAAGSPYAGWRRPAARAGRARRGRRSPTRSWCRRRAAARSRSISSWSGPCAGAAGARGRASPSGRCRRRVPSRTFSTTGSAERSTRAGQVHLRVQRRSRPGGRPAPPSGPTTPTASPRSAAAAVVHRRGQQRLADALALAARQHGVRRQAPQRLAAVRRGDADHRRSRPRRPSSRRGRCRRKWRVRSIQTARCGSRAPLRRRPGARGIRVSSSKKPSSLSARRPARRRASSAGSSRLPHGRP